MRPRLWIIAGPNGAGKTTYAQANLRELISQGAFLNADDVARDLSPLSPESATMASARAVLRRRADHLRRKSSFAIETTLASRTLLRTLGEARSEGYEIELIFLFISDVELSIERVARRVMAGGHFIPTNVVMRRYVLGLRLLPAYIEASDLVQVLNADGRPFVIASKDGHGLRVHDHTLWGELRRPK